MSDCQGYKLTADMNYKESTVLEKICKSSRKPLWQVPVSGRTTGDMVAFAPKYFISPLFPHNNFRCIEINLNLIILS